MKNYYTQLSELKIARERLNVLEQKKEIYLRRVTSAVSVIKDIVVVGGKAPDKMSEYVIKCEKIDKEIEELKDEIAILEKGIDAMNSYLDDIRYKTDLEKQVFILHYKEGKKADEIAELLPCGIATVYRKLKKIEKMLKNDSK